jgi:disulfide bond formation protein DsbB
LGIFAVETDIQPRSRQSGLAWLALLVAVCAVCASIYLSVGQKQRTCTLCLYERAFAMGTAAVLFLGVWLRDLPRGTASLLALPMAMSGAALATIQSAWESTGLLECPKGFRDIGSVPQQALVVLGLLAALLVLDLIVSGRLVGMTIASAGGVLLAWLCLLSAPESTGPNYAMPVNDDVCRTPRSIPEPAKERDDEPEKDL